jgi:hypothetical protein
MSVCHLNDPIFLDKVTLGHQVVCREGKEANLIEKIGQGLGYRVRRSNPIGEVKYVALLLTNSHKNENLSEHDLEAELSARGFSVIISKKNS